MKLIILILACLLPLIKTPSQTNQLLMDITKWDNKFNNLNKKEAETLGKKIWDALNLSDFEYLKTEKFKAGHMSHWIVIVKHKKTGIEFSLIPGGKFRIGSPKTEKYRDPDEGPNVEITIQPYLIARTEITNNTYKRLYPDHTSGYVYTKNIQKKKSPTKLGPISLNGKENPAVLISWQDAREFCKKYGFRLPSEAEWEYAARALTRTPWFWGQNPLDAYMYANVADLSGKALWEDWKIEAKINDNAPATSRVGAYKPNPFGLYDILGNVMEWCEDTYTNSYNQIPLDGKPFTKESRTKVARGGSWRHPIKFCRCAFRDKFQKDKKYDFIGFRPVKTIILR